MSVIDAVYQDGVFKPMGTVGLRENQRVRLQVEPLDRMATQGWIDEVRQLQDTIVKRRGGKPLPDSSAEIADDRMRDA